MHQYSVLIDSKFNFFYYFQCWIYNEYLFLATFQSWKLLSLESPISIHSSICQSKTLYRLKINNFTLPPPTASLPPFTRFSSFIVTFKLFSLFSCFELFVICFRWMTQCQVNNWWVPDKSHHQLWWAKYNLATNCCHHLPLPHLLMTTGYFSPPNYLKNVSYV